MNQRFFDKLLADGIFDRYKSGETWDAWSARRLLDPLLYGAETVHVPMQGWRALGKAAAEQRLSQTDMLSTIAQRQVPRVGRHIQRTGFEAILVDLIGTADTPASFEVFAAVQGICVSDLKKLQSCGELTSIEPSPKHQTTAGKTKRLGHSPEAIHASHVSFVSLRKLALSLRLSADAVQALLCQLKIAPAHGCRSVYLRGGCAARHFNSFAP